MKKLIVILLSAFFSAVSFGQGSEEYYNVTGYNRVQTDNLLVIGEDSVNSTTQVDSKDTTLLTLQFYRDSVNTAGLKAATPLEALTGKSDTAAMTPYTNNIFYEVMKDRSENIGADSVYYSNDTLKLYDNNVEISSTKIDSVDYADKIGIQDSIILDTNIIVLPTQKAAMYWDNASRTFSINLGNGVILQVGQENLVNVYNNTGSVIENGRVVGGSGLNGNAITVEKASNNGRYSALLMTTEIIQPGTHGFAASSGKVRGIDLSTYIKAPFYLGVDGLITVTEPQFPLYSYPLGAITNNTVDGSVEFRSDNVDFKNTITNAFNGGFRESIDFIVSSDGATITGSLEQTGGGDLTMMFSDGYFDLDCTPAQEITLVPGTLTNPQTNYVYILQSTKTLTVSTSGFPMGVEHIKIFDGFLTTPAETQITGPLANRNWNDHIESVDGQGHLLHIAERIRQDNAQWSSGTEGVMTVGASTTLDVSTTGGFVYQLHKQSVDAQSTSTGDDLHIVNNFASPYLRITDLESQTIDALGNSLSNTSFSYVLWGVANKSGQANHLMINLPTGSYSKNIPDNAVKDANNSAVYDIPSAFKGKGFLIARFTMIYSNGNWTLYETENLRGKVPNNVAGGGGGGGTGVTDFLSLTDTESSYIGQALKLLFVGAGEGGVEFSDKTTTDLDTIGINRDSIISIGDQLDDIDSLIIATNDRITNDSLNNLYATTLEVLTGKESNKAVPPTVLNNFYEIMSATYPIDSINAQLIGTIDGVNNTFATLAPFIKSSTIVIRNGITQELGVDYVESSNFTIVFQSGSIPTATSNLTVTYKH